MIKVKITKDSQVNNIHISGHSGYDDLGKDIVCASVSSIVITTVNAIIKLDETSIDYEVNDGDMIIEVLKHNDYIDNLINNMIDLLKELEQKYKKNIKII